MTQSGIDDRIQIHPDGIYEPPAEAGWNEGALDVDSRHDLSYDEFIREYVRRKKPVVIKNGVSTDSITPETLHSLAGHRPLANLSGGTGSRFLVRGPASSIEKFRSLTTLGDYLEHFTEPGSELPYLTNLSVSKDVSEAAGAFAAPKYFQPNWNSKWPFSALNFDNRGDAEVFISPPGRSYGVLHYDRHALYLGICQYYGKKLWWLCPPEQSAFLYPVGGGYQNISGVNPLNPDLRKFPLYSQGKAVCRDTRSRRPDVCPQFVVASDPGCHTEYFGPAPAAQSAQCRGLSVGHSLVSEVRPQVAAGCV